MIHRLAPAALERTGRPPDGDTASIESWLEVFGRLLPLPEKTRQAIIDELEQHLRERVRDLMLAGQPEHDALRLALDELGSAAELAHRFKIADRPGSRRLMMHIAIAGIGVASLVTAGMLLSSSQHGFGASFYQAPVVADERAELDDVSVALRFDSTPLEEVFTWFSEVVESDLVVYWCDLQLQGISPDTPVTITLERKRPLPQVIRLALDSAARPDWPAIDWRYGDGLLEFSTRQYFDRREVQLATFEVSGVLRDLERHYAIDREASTQMLSGLVHEYVEPDIWQANGGDVGQLTVVGSTMVIRAPARSLSEVEWILARLEAAEAVSDSGAFGIGGGAGGTGGSGGFGGAGGAGGSGGAGAGDRGTAGADAR
jgi:uncharacterized membrane protein YgcG